tara:strand:+ start:979 stop:1425 length:447 start_codon:yes stop_codon:yes gene_type:complete
MRAVIQRVECAQVSIDKQIIGSISNGILLYLGIHNTDTLTTVTELGKKISSLRIFPDDNKKMNLSLNDIKGDLLIISQFTLYANCKKGNRPSFINAADPVYAKKIYNEFVNYMTLQKNINIQTGKFGEDMQILSTNYGPVTILLDTDE